MDCIFCKIIKGEIPCHKVYEDEDFLAFLDINPVSNGHILIVPKNHVERFKDLSYEDIASFYHAFSHVIQKVEEHISTDYNIGINQGKFAGQVVDHLHIHIIPRYENDGLAPWPSKQLNNEDAKALVSKMHP